MSINFSTEDKAFILETKNTAYVFKILHDKYPVHLFYGDKAQADKAFYKESVLDFAPYTIENGQFFSKEVAASEYSLFGSGDFRTAALKVRSYTGSTVTALEYKSHKIFKGRYDIPDLPYATSDNNTNTLELMLTDNILDIDVSLFYTVFFECDVITRHAKIYNNGKKDIYLEKVMCFTLDLPEAEYDMISIGGEYFYECNYIRSRLMHGNRTTSSRYGSSGHKHNPFFAISSKDMTEQSGSVWGFNLVYSGDFLNETEIDRGKLRVQSGINPDTLLVNLKKGEVFHTPEAVLSYSKSGLSQLSNNFYSFIRKHILSASAAYKKAVVLNSWEACYFDINESLLIDFADECAKTGIDLLVIDDGWFGERDDDSTSLGDWYVNKSKFKNGLKSFSDKLHEKNIKFGIWVEPEMISPKSKLFAAHSDWVLGDKSRNNSLSRRQLCLDLTKDEVIEHLKKTFTEVFKDTRVDYIKWDMNRYLSDVYTNSLSPEKQGEANHRFLLGTYKLLRLFKEQWPDAIIETCSGGGGRFDLGMMKYSSQIWTSDNTKPEDRIKIQHGVSVAYPPNVMSCHVSSPNNICDDLKEADYRFKVAASGVLGYELNILKASDSFRSEIKKQIIFYKSVEEIILKGTITRLSDIETGVSCFYYSYKNQMLVYILSINASSYLFSIDTDKKDYIDVESNMFYSSKNLKNGLIINFNDKKAIIMHLRKSNEVKTI